MDAQGQGGVMVTAPVKAPVKAPDTSPDEWSNPDEEMRPDELCPGQIRPVLPEEV